MTNKHPYSIIAIDMQERGQNRLKGLRNAAGTAVLAVSIAACGNNNVETPKPTVLQTEKPTPTLVTPEVTASPIVTPEVTATPIVTPEVTATPEATPVPISNLVDQIIKQAETSGWTKTTKQEVTNSITEAYSNDPKAATLINPEANTLEKDIVNNIWNTCSSSTDTAVKRQVCAGLLGHLYYEGLLIDGNDVWLKPISEVIYYAHTTLGSQDFNAFKNFAEDSGIT